RLPEQYEALAHHYYKGQEWEKALDYLVKAGDKAAASYANQDALDYYASALEVCEKLGDAAMKTASAVAGKRGFVNQTVGDLRGAIADFERMLDAALSLGNRRLEGMALAYRGGAEVWEHDYKAAEETLTAALTVAEEGFDDVRLSASLWLGIDLIVTNRHAEAKPLMSAVEELVETVDDRLSQGWWGEIGGNMRNWVGRFDEGLELITRWREPAKDNLQTAVMNAWAEALARGGRGEYQQALRIVDEVIETCERTGFSLVLVRALNTMGWLYGEIQNHARAMEWNARGVEAAGEAHFPDPEVESNARLNLGDNLLALGRLEEAEEQFKIVEQVARNPRPEDRWMLWRYSQHLFHSYGELWLGRGEHDQALSYADECLALAEESESRKNVVKGRRLRGQALLAQGKLSEAEREFATALEIAQEIGNPPQLWKTHAALGELRQAQGRRDEARQCYRDAIAVIEGVAQGLTEESLRETFLSSDHVQGIRREAGG
ncbi:MAG: tetratricopeptide repeat protein, partial [Chloroflexi bacterium]|nr:tetratricopeptide repeat protein [Chloroflexota bacterium]